MTFEVKILSEDTWELFIDGNQVGQYKTAAAAKARARRFLPTSARRLVWYLPAVGDKKPVWRATA